MISIWFKNVSLSLEEKLDCHGITQEVLYGNLIGRRGTAKLVAKADWKKCLRDALDHQSSAAAAADFYILAQALGHGIGPWLQWNCLTAIFQELTKPAVGSKPSYLCDIDQLNGPYFNHFLSSHCTIQVTPSTIIHLLADGDQSIFTLAKRLHNS